ncbi:hypothetical protein MSP8886_01445 [Marinomonas spartinae]|uniref:Lipoprotein n=1 Tax=Marinomonas spartinae TaxID=1792290 RepID=A0A1A8T8V2_9GAMM|nr:hypothetical protein [Marinomonas spartinae]SBS29117.1 hypothetical protein MSP8886_01445 [Marinomonas spartinae]
MKQTILLTVALSLTGCTSMIDTMDSFAGMGKLTVDKNSFDNTKIIYLTPDALYNPDASIFDPVSTRLGAVWTSKSPQFVNLTFQEDGGYVKFDEVAFKVNGKTKIYPIGLSDLDFDNSKLSGMKSTAYALIPMSEFKNILTAKTCQMKIEKATGYEVASCSIDRIPGGKRTAILGFRNMLKAIEEKK